ncbi:MAG: hypothetical protein QXZ63_03540 [Sulfolobales archaeon]
MVLSSLNILRRVQCEEPLDITPHVRLEISEHLGIVVVEDMVTEYMATLFRDRGA